jgi:hypothetical protein
MKHWTPQQKTVARLYRKMQAKGVQFDVRQRGQTIAIDTCWRDIRVSEQGDIVQGVWDAKSAFALQERQYHAMFAHVGLMRRRKLYDSARTMLGIIKDQRTSPFATKHTDLDDELA